MKNSKASAITYVRAKKNGEQKFFALIAKGSTQTATGEGKCFFLIYTSEQLVQAIEEENSAISYREDGFRWKGLKRDKVLRDPIAVIDVDHAWTSFKVGKNGTMSDDQERTVIEALNDGTVQWKQGSEALQGLRWKWTGHNHRRGIHDGVADADENADHPTIVEFGGVWVEVKGVNGRLFYS